jgi:hypothetical protein
MSDIDCKARAEAAEARLRELEAALPALKVKSLVWEDWSARHRTNITALTKFGRYSVVQLHFPEMHYKIESPDGKTFSADTLEAAKAAAQADYEAAALSALDLPATEEARAHKQADEAFAQYRRGFTGGV